MVLPYTVRLFNNVKVLAPQEHIYFHRREELVTYSKERSSPGLLSGEEPFSPMHTPTKVKTISTLDI